MFGKIKEFWSKPITWGGYTTLCLFSFIAGGAYAIVYAYYTLAEFRIWCQKFMFWKKKGNVADFEDEGL